MKSKNLGQQFQRRRSAKLLVPNRQSGSIIKFKIAALFREEIWPAKPSQAIGILSTGLLSYFDIGQIDVGPFWLVTWLVTKMKVS